MESELQKTTDVIGSSLDDVQKIELINQICEGRYISGFRSYYDDILDT